MMDIVVRVKEHFAEQLHRDTAKERARCVSCAPDRGRVTLLLLHRVLQSQPRLRQRGLWWEE